MRARSIARPSRLVMVSSSSPTPEIKMTGPTASRSSGMICSSEVSGIEFFKRSLIASGQQSTAAIWRRLDDFAPVGRGELPAELRARGLHAGGVAPADRVQLDAGLEVEKFGRLSPRV